MYNEADELAKLLRSAGIGAAIIGPVEGILYRDPAEAVELLFERLNDCAESFKLLPAAVINPAFPGWRSLLAKSIDKGIVAVKMYPNYHDYQANGEQARELVEAATEAGLPVICCVRVEDERQHHWHMLMPPVPASEVAELAKAVEGARVILASANQREIEAFLTEAPPERSWAEVSYLKSPINSVEYMVQRFGHERLLLGTHAPFLTPGVSVAKVKQAAISDEAKQAILLDNARRIWPELR